MHLISTIVIAFAVLGFAPAVLLQTLVIWRRRDRDA